MLNKFQIKYILNVATISNKEKLMEDDSLIPEADATIDSPAANQEVISPSPATGDVTEDVGEPELRINGVETAPSQQDVWNENSYSGGDTTVIQPSESFQIDEPEPEISVEQTDDNVEIGSNHMENENYPTEEVSQVESTEPEPQPLTTEEPVIEDTITPVAPIQPVSEPKKDSKKTLIIVIGAVLLACAGVLIFILTR